MKPKFKCKSNAQKYAIRAYYAKKNKAQKSDCREQEKQRERYMKAMAEDFPKDFMSDDEWDYIEAMAHWPNK